MLELLLVFPRYPIRYRCRTLLADIKPSQNGRRASGITHYVCVMPTLIHIAHIQRLTSKSSRASDAMVSTYRKLKTKVTQLKIHDFYCMQKKLASRSIFCYLQI
jgi:hypothetical protein